MAATWRFGQGDGRLAILRGRAGDYVRSTLSETTGFDADPVPLDETADASCSADLCAATIGKDGRRWQLLATRSRHRVEIAALARACSAADIVVSDRRLPRTCRPRWLKLDRAFLDRSGGVAILLGEHPDVRTVADQVGEHPWAASAPISLNPRFRHPLRESGSPAASFRKPRSTALQPQEAVSALPRE
jgi:competence protein ComEC